MFGTPIQIRIEDEEMIVSNRCILPNGWTVDTLMKPHDSVPYNPDIAGAFFRAGYIETWGQGINKICEACREIGADVPEYELTGNGLRVHFKALESALIDQSKTHLKRQNDVLNGALTDVLSGAIIEELRKSPKMTQRELDEKLGISYRSLQRKMDALKEAGYIERIGSRKEGYWKVMK